MDKHLDSLRRFLSVKVHIRALFPGCLAVLVSFVLMPSLVQAQQVNQPSYDPKQIEKRFEDQQLTQEYGRRPQLPTMRFNAGEQQSSAPLMSLRHVIIKGAATIPLSRLASAYEAYVGR